MLAAPQLVHSQAIAPRRWASCTCGPVPYQTGPAQYGQYRAAHSPDGSSTAASA